MAKSVLELAVGTGQWDAGLKKAKSALDNFMQSQGGLQSALAKDSENMRKFVQMMGKTESTAKTAKGQMNDYKSTIEQLTMQYNRMTEAQKKTIGQDYLNSIDQLKQKYQSVNEEIQEMNRSLNNVKLPDMKDAGGGLFSGLGDKMSGALQVFAGNMLTKAAGAVANLGSEMVDMVQQGVELARQGEGIRIAFERLGRGDILDGLREATHGTVTDLELMKAAVKFNDFKLPVEELGTMLAFAQQKAKDTGQSVDYMVDSIVTGLGRKSLMILDNLGLSATEVKEKMKETGDMTKAVGEIIREQMSKAGDYVETAADRAAQANVSLQNKMEELGRKFAPLEEASNNFWTSMKIGILDIVGGPLTDLLNKLTQAGRMANAYGLMGGNAKVGRMTSNLAGASEGNRQSIYQQQQEQFWRYINPREQQIKDIRAWQSGDRNEALQKRIGAITEKYGSLDATKIQAEVDAAKKMLSDYQQAAKQILQPIEQKIVPTVGDGGSGGKSRKGKGKVSAVYADDSIAWQEQEVARLTKLWKEAGDAVRDDYATQLGYAKQKLAEMTGGFNPNNVRPIADLSGKAPSPDFTRDLKMNGHKQYDAMAPVAPDKIEFSDNLQQKMDSLTKGGQDTAKAWRSAQSAIGSVGNALSGLKNPAIDIMTVIGQAIATVALAYAETLAKDKSSKSNIWTFIAAAAASTISLATTIASIHSSTGYAQGGIVKGNSYSGDNIYAGNDTMVNAGELILNRSQQLAVASQLQSNSPLGGGRLVARLKGADILLSLERQLAVTGKGELATFK